MNSRDIAALDAAVAAGLVAQPSGPLVPEATVEEALFRAIAFHLSRALGRVEDASGLGRHEELGFTKVLDDWDEAWRVPAYPMAIVLTESRREDFSIAGPRPEPDPTDPAVDWISADDAYALFRLGEESGEGRVTIYATYKPHVKALTAAVERALRGGSSDRGACAHLPLPECCLPTPFQGVLLPAQYPKARVWPRLPSGSPENEAGAEEGTWRADVRFSWNAPKLVGFPRVGDFTPSVETVVEYP